MTLKQTPILRDEQNFGYLGTKSTISGASKGDSN